MLISYWDKDFTDGERAIKVARSTPFVFLGLVGEEVDHLLGNFSLLRQAFSMIKPAVAYGINETILYGRDFSLNLPQGTTFSIVPCSRILLSEKGSKWELQDALLSGYATPPISNIATGTVQHIHGSNEFFLIVKGYWNPFSELTA
jgi:thiamine pyrophosphokinase